MSLNRSIASVFATLAGMLFAAAVSAATLNVTRAGSGAGMVTASSGAINCGATCTDTYTNGTMLTLTATPAGGAQFTGWLGACAGTSTTCPLTLNANATATATFAPVSIGTLSLDIDANAGFDALTDGLLAIRYLFGLTGPSLSTGAIGAGAGRNTPGAISDYLNDIRPVLDIDGNGQADALTDGLLIIRYLFGLRGSSLILGAIAPGAPRSTAPPIEAQIALVSLAGPAIARIEATPGALLLTQSGATGQLAATAFNAQDMPLAASIAWSSSNPAIVSVSATGQVQAAVASGNAKITATSNGVSSPPVYVTIGAPVPGAVLLTDTQIVSGPTPVNPNASPAPGNQFEVVLSGVAAMPVGTIMINTEGKVVGGRVVSVTPQGMNLLVRLEVPTPQQMFASIEFKDTIDVTKLAFETPPDFAAQYDVAQVGNAFDYTPKAGMPLGRAALAKSLEATLEDVPAIPPFSDCEVSPNSMSLPLPLSLAAQPLFSLQVNGTLTQELTQTGRKVLVTAAPEFKVNSVLEVTAAFEAKASCKLVLHKRKVRVPGWAGLFFGGDIEFGVGAEVSGKATVTGAKVGGSVTINGSIQAGIQCNAANGNCGLIGDANATAPTITPTFQLPALNQIKFEPAVMLFGFIKAELGNADIEQLQFEALEAKVGPKLAGSYTIEAIQIDNIDANDGRAKYSMTIEGEVGPGIKLGDFLQYTGLANFVPLKLSFSGALGESPTGSATADRGSYLPGEMVTVNVALNQASTLFPIGTLYNVDSVSVLRKDGGFTTQTLATQAATPGQTNFTFQFMSPGLVSASELFAFVVPKFLGFGFLPKLEVGAAVGQSVVQAAGGTFRNAAAGTIGTSLIVRLRNPDGSLLQTATNFSVQGPAGWNSGQPLALSYPLGTARQFYSLTQAPVTGTYTVNLTIGGTPFATTFNVNAASVLDSPGTVSPDLTTSGQIGSSWNAVAGASSYLTRVFDIPNNKILQPVAFTTASSATLVGVPANNSGQKALQVFAFSNDMTPGDPPIPSFFDMSFHRALLNASVTVSPGSTVSTPGAVVNLTATVNGLANTAVTWANANATGPNSAQFTTPSSPGTYTITATSSGNSSFKGIATVTVGGGGSSCTGGDAMARITGFWRIVAGNGFNQNCFVGQFAQFLNEGTIQIEPSGQPNLILSHGMLGYTGVFSCTDGVYQFRNPQVNLQFGLVHHEAEFGEPENLQGQIILRIAGSPGILPCQANIQAER